MRLLRGIGGSVRSSAAQVAYYIPTASLMNSAIHHFLKSFLWQIVKWSAKGHEIWSSTSVRNQVVHSTVLIEFFITYVSSGKSPLDAFFYTLFWFRLLFKPGDNRVGKSSISQWNVVNKSTWYSSITAYCRLFRPRETILSRMWKIYVRILHVSKI